MHFFKFSLSAILLTLTCSFHSYAQDNNGMHVLPASLYGEKVVQISFDSKPKEFGKLTVKNQQGKVVLQVDEFDIIQTPNYNAISVETFLPGNYVFVLESGTTSFTQEVKL